MVAGMSEIPPPPPSMSPPPGYQPYGNFGVAPRSLGKATASMVCGIVGLLICTIVLAPVALGLGISAKNEIDRNPGMYQPWSGAGRVRARHHRHLSDPGEHRRLQLDLQQVT